MNSYEQGDGTVVADICTFADAEVVQDLYLENLRAGKRIAEPELRRFRIDPAAGTVTGERLTEKGFELPRINYGRCNERPYRYAWGVGTGDSGWLEQIVKADLDDGSTNIWSLPDHYPGEPVFVPAPARRTRTTASSSRSSSTPPRAPHRMLVLDAHDLSELAHAEVPHHIPFGFHGQFAPV